MPTFYVESYYNFVKDQNSVCLYLEWMFQNEKLQQ